MGLKYKDGSFIGETNSYFKYLKIKNFCKNKKFKFELNNPFGKRSEDYREVFKQHYPPVRSLRYGKVHYCAYCGRPLKKESYQVDHIYPVALINSNIKLQNKLIRKGYISVNDYRNLTPSCSKCNQKKGAKLSWLYVVKGKIGQHPYLARLINNTKIVAIIFIVLLTFLYFAIYQLNIFINLL